MTNFDSVKDSGERRSFPTGSVRDVRTGKGRYDLLPVLAIRRLAKHTENGALKYGDRNWERGMNWSRPFAALMRHMWAWWRGEDRDPETGLSHLAHAGCCILFLLTYQGHATGKDDRPHGTE